MACTYFTPGDAKVLNHYAALTYLMDYGNISAASAFFEFFNNFKSLNYNTMGVPKKHKTRSGRDQRRGHLALKKTSFAVCKNCGSPARPHMPCMNCGYYKGRKVGK